MDKLLEFAKQAGLKGQSETALSPQELAFAKLVAGECIYVIKGDDKPLRPYMMDRRDIIDNIKQHFDLE